MEEGAPKIENMKPEDVLGSCYKASEGLRTYLEFQNSIRVESPDLDSNAKDLFYEDAIRNPEFKKMSPEKREELLDVFEFIDSTYEKAPENFSGEELLEKYEDIDDTLQENLRGSKVGDTERKETGSVINKLAKQKAVVERFINHEGR